MISILNCQKNEAKGGQKYGCSTDWKAQIDGKVRTGSKQARGTHKLEHTDRWASQDSKKVRGAHHLKSTDGWASQDREQVSKQRGLTNWIAQMGG